jgi:hypothetical protein
MLIEDRLVAKISEENQDAQDSAAIRATRFEEKIELSEHVRGLACHVELKIF